MLANRLYLIVFEADKDSSMTRPGLRLVIDFIEDQLETEQTDLTHIYPTLFLMRPILREAELLHVEAQRALSILDEEDSSCVEVVHDPLPSNYRTLVAESSSPGQHAREIIRLASSAHALAVEAKAWEDAKPWGFAQSRKLWQLRNRSLTGSGNVRSVASEIHFFPDCAKENAVIATIRPTRANLLIIDNLLFSSTAELFVFARPRRPNA